MAMDTKGIHIPIFTSLNDKGIKQATKSLNSLEFSAKKLAKTLGYSLSATAIVAFGKASVKAFMADDAAARQLAQTLGNLGQGFADIQVEQFIAKMQDATGVLDDQLRPAMASLLAQTKDYMQAEKLLGIALDVSAGSGKDLQSVTNALGRAYQGNYTALARLNVGISASEAKTLDFATATDKLIKTWGGASTLDTAARRFARLKAAGADAMESIGSGIMDAFKNLTGGAGNVEKLMQGIRNFGYVVGAEIAGLAEGVRKIITNIMNSPLGAVIRAIQKTSRAFYDKLGITKAIQEDIAQGQAKQIANQKAITEQYKKTTAAANQTANAAKKVTDAAKTKLALDKASAVLNQAQKLFDIDRIQLAAAEQAKLTEEERARIKVKQDILNLEDAINEGNVTAAAKISQTLVNDAQLLGQLSGLMTSLNGIPNPFEAWLASLQQMLSALQSVTGIKPAVNYTPNTGGLGYINPSWGSLSDLIGRMGGTNYPGDMTPSLPDWSSAISSGFGAAAALNAPTVNVTVQGSVTTERDLVNAITQGLYNNQASGTPVLYNTGY